MPIRKDVLLESLPPQWPEDLLPQIQRAVRASRTKLVVLDDDPTGNQTVHDVAVLTEGSVPLLTAALNEPDPVVYVLTNSRSLPLEKARALNQEIAANLQAARAATGREVAIVSRSDSTLRGHYPGETNALAEALDEPLDVTLIVPFFIEGGRITANDVHYVTAGNRLIPAAETEYARDATFGYAHSNLREWVSEKHKGAVRPEEVASITLDDVRVRGPEAVSRKLLGLPRGSVCIVNAVSYRDLEVTVAGLLDAESQGLRCLYRTAASFVRVRGGITPQPLLRHSDLFPETVGTPMGGGLIVVGSHVEKTTRQVRAAETRPGVHRLDLSVPALLDPATREAEIAHVTAATDALLAAGEKALVCTSRELVTEAGAMTGLEIGQRVSDSLVTLVQKLDTRPAWMIAKGGITSSDIATRGLGVRRAEVLGQAIPGVPVWRTGPESRHPGLIYVVFPGNVGDDQALARMIGVLNDDGPRD